MQYKINLKAISDLNNALTKENKNMDKLKETVRQYYDIKEGLLKEEYNKELKELKKNSDKDNVIKEINEYVNERLSTYLELDETKTIEINLLMRINDVFKDVNGSKLEVFGSNKFEELSYSKADEEKMNVLKDKLEKDCKNLSIEYRNVIMLVNTCETPTQAREEVLKKYKIINNDGTLNI